MVSQTVYSVVIFSHIYFLIVTASISKLLHSWLFIDPSEHHYTTQTSKFNNFSNRSSTMLKGKFPQTTMWIGWEESNFRNPSVEVWAHLDNPFKRSDYTKLCMSPSLDGILPGFVISQEDNSPLTLYIDFHNFKFFLDINSPFDQVQS